MAAASRAAVAAAECCCWSVSVNWCGRCWSGCHWPCPRHSTPWGSRSTAWSGCSPCRGSGRPVPSRTRLTSAAAAAFRPGVAAAAAAAGYRLRALAIPTNSTTTTRTSGYLPPSPSSSPGTLLACFATLDPCSGPIWLRLNLNFRIRIVEYCKSAYSI